MTDYAQEYLLVPSLATSTLSHFSVQLIDLHRDLALQCLTYISFNNFASGACYDKPSYMTATTPFSITSLITEPTMSRN